MTEETFRIVVTVGVGIALLGVILMTIAAMAMMKSLGKVRERVDDLSGRAAPILTTVDALTNSMRVLTEENSPRISEIVRNAREVSNDARDITVAAKEQVHRFAEVGHDIADRTQLRVAKLDAAVDNTIDRAQAATETVKMAVVKPIREVSGIAAGVKAAVSTLAQAQGRRPNIAHATLDEEMFI